MQQESQAQVLNSDSNIEDFDLISEIEALPQLDNIDLRSLQNYSNLFEQEFQNRQESPHSTPDNKRFHGFIVKIIEMIQPSKVTMSQILETNSDSLSKFFHEDQKEELRKTAKEKNILVMNRLSLNQEEQLFTKVQENIELLKKCLMLRESQLGMVLYIEDHSDRWTKEAFVEQFEKNFSEIKQYTIPKDQCFKPINYYLLSNILEYEVVFYREFHQKCKQLKKDIQSCHQILEEGNTIKTAKKSKIEHHIKRLKIIGSKIQSIAELFPYACIKNHDDLLCQPHNHPRWKKLFENNIISFKLYGDHKKVSESFQNLKAYLNIINAAMSIMSQGGKGYGTALSAIRKVLHVALSKNKALHEAECMIAEPNEKLAKDIWNLPERKQLKAFIEMSLPAIQYSVRFFIPRLANEYFEKRFNNNQKIDFPDYTIKDPLSYFKSIVKTQDQEDRVPIRINNSFKMHFKFTHEEDQQKKNYFSQKIQNVTKSIVSSALYLRDKYTNFGSKMKPTTPKSVIFHIHGGGFISMSSFIHQTYTRTWSNNLEVPIVSVDYGKAPEHPYPEGLKDCFQAYMWTLNCMKQLYEFEPVKIILVGDSAGGNLVASLFNLLIEWNIRLPDGICLIYPALNLNLQGYTPSFLTSLNDMILPHTFLKICLKSYIKDPQFKPAQDHFISPILTPDQMLKKYPPTRIFVGSKDPFHDDCCRFAQRLSQCGIDNLKLKIFEEFPHGFLQFDMKNQPHYYCRQALKDVEKSLAQLLGIDHKEDKQEA